MSAPEIAIAPDEWAAMLREAGAPEPWAAADAPQRFADEITFRWPEPLKPARPVRTAHTRAHEAIAELRRVAPEIIADYERRSAALDSGRFDSVAPGSGALAARIRTMVVRECDQWRSLLAALPKPQREPRAAQPWNFDAWRLYAAYLRYVDPAAGMSAAGPAVRFIARALRRMGSRSATVEQDELCAAVAKALQRVRRRLRQQRDQLTGTDRP